MKYLVPSFLISLFLVSACGKGKHDHVQSQGTGDSTNQALTIMVLGIHDEVMPKGDDLYRLKKKLQDTLANNKGLTAEKKAEFEALILSLDSARVAMEKWMHEFNPNRDSADQEKMREYLETEIEKINRIKEQTNEVIGKAKGEIKK